jgi:hypothetical protein
LVTTGETALTFGDPGYRDALCVFIDHEAFAAWLPRLAPDGAAWLVVQRTSGSDLLARWIAADLGRSVERVVSSKGFRVLQVTR